MEKQLILWSSAQPMANIGGAAFQQSKESTILVKIPKDKVSRLIPCVLTCIVNYQHSGSGTNTVDIAAYIDKNTNAVMIFGTTSTGNLEVYPYEGDDKIVLESTKDLTLVGVKPTGAKIFLKLKATASANVSIWMAARFTEGVVKQ